jgi:methyltransferase (TIGR00027 family)
MSLRKTLGDELVREMHGSSYAVRQVVSIGAGYDSRAFRLPHADVSYFEVDSHELFDLKEPLVADLPLGAAGCTRRTVPGFLGAPGFELGRELRSAGHDPSKPTVWLMEGLLPYLTRTQCTALATELGNISAPGSALWGDSFSHTSVARGMVFHGVPFSEGLDDYDEVRESESNPRAPSLFASPGFHHVFKGLQPLSARVRTRSESYSGRSSGSSAAFRGARPTTWAGWSWRRAAPDPTPPCASTRRSASAKSACVAAAPA